MGARGVIILVSALVLLGLALFMFDFPRPASDDMAPNIRRGDLLLACRMCGAPARGDVVLFTPPDSNDGLSMRRVVALPGDRVAVKKGMIRVNGAPLATGAVTPLRLANQSEAFVATVETNGAHQYRVVQDARVTPGGDRAEQTLGDEYFLAADRRTLVKDSRDYGPIAHAAVRSTVLRIIHRGDGDSGRPARIP